jgi:hypothetical protein
MKRRLWLAALGATALVAFAPLVAGGSSWAADGCGEFSALGSAVGVATFQSAPGLLLTDGDASMPGAQAALDSLTGASSWAGAPFSSAGAGNVGLAGVDANQVPVFAVSSYPSNPDEHQSTPTGTVEAKSGPQSSTARVASGGAPSDSASAGRIMASADAACDTSKGLLAAANNSAEMIGINGVVRIASVTSDATVKIDKDGHSTLVGTMSVEGMTILGQPAAITDKGVVIGGSAVPLPDNPLLQALSDAGITLRYLSAVKNAKEGDVLAPGLEISVSKGVQGAGTGPATTTYEFGRAHARATTASDAKAAGAPTATASNTPVATGAGTGVSPVPTPPARPDAVGTSSAMAAPAVASGSTVPAPVSLGRPSPQRDGERAAPLPALPIASAPDAGPYLAIATGALLLLAAWAASLIWGKNIRWR